MVVIGLTGGIGAGKSAVSARLAERGAVVIDADAIVHELQQPGQPVLAGMVERFGPAILAAGGTLDRAAVADLVFGDDPDAQANLVDLNAIVWPAVGEEIARRLADLEGTDEVAVLDVPLMVESGRSDLTGLLVVDCPVDLAVQRVVGQRGMDEADARARIARQASREERLARADHVIDNSGDLTQLEREVEKAWGWIQSLRHR